MKDFLEILLFILLVFALLRIPGFITKHGGMENSIVYVGHKIKTIADRIEDGNCENNKP